MTVYLKIKALSKRKPLIERAPCVIDEHIATSNALIASIVRRNVDEYNKKTVDAPLFPYLTDDGLANGAKTGKIGFNDRKNENSQDADLAVENALSCFRDGIFKLFINDEEKEYGVPAELKDGDEITFIRLTMLAGRMW
ncbi:MAG: hypothetical protein LBV07_05805 [Syntrophobacterales bacterium]|jgi:hypothetical protein|nr:hypothetical protein [Syntrophobacterales bacterium]